MPWLRLPGWWAKLLATPCMRDACTCIGVHFSHFIYGALPDGGGIGDAKFPCVARVRSSGAAIAPRGACLGLGHRTWRQCGARSFGSAWIVV
jgi:hypothetical protein